jgi:RNA-binding protein
MTALTITPTQRKSLKADAHGLSPVVMISSEGLTPSVLKEAKNAIAHHGLIKVRVFGDDREERIAIYEALCDKLDAAPVQHIGKLLVLWRPKDAVDAALIYKEQANKLKRACKHPALNVNPIGRQPKRGLEPAAQIDLSVVR